MTRRTSSADGSGPDTARLATPKQSLTPPRHRRRLRPSTGSTGPWSVRTGPDLPDDRQDREDPRRRPDAMQRPPAPGVRTPVDLPAVRHVPRFAHHPDDI